MARSKSPSDAALLALRAFGLAYPGAHTKSPWPGHMDLAVNDKTFAYLSVEGDPFSISCKLPHSNSVAMMLPYAKPTAYGLGKSGWVSATPPAGEEVDIQMFQEWIDESYRAQAPKKLVAQLSSGAAKTPAAKPRAAKRHLANTPVSRKAAMKKPAKKPATKKPAAAKKR